jgi:hypothetical protein
MKCRGSKQERDSYHKMKKQKPEHVRFKREGDKKVKCPTRGWMKPLVPLTRWRDVTLAQGKKRSERVERTMALSGPETINFEPFMAGMPFCPYPSAPFYFNLSFLHCTYPRPSLSFTSDPACWNEPIYDPCLTLSCLSPFTRFTIGLERHPVIATYAYLHTCLSRSSYDNILPKTTPPLNAQSQSRNHSLLESTQPPYSPYQRASQPTTTSTTFPQENTTRRTPFHTANMGFIESIRAKVELYRLEQRYTHRNKRTTFTTGARYVDGEYIFNESPGSPTGSTGSWQHSTTSSKRGTAVVKVKELMSRSVK